MKSITPELERFLRILTDLMRDSSFPFLARWYFEYFFMAYS